MVGRKKVGLRIRIIKLNERLYDVFDIDLRTEVLEKADWLTSNIIDKRLRLNINSNLIKNIINISLLCVNMQKQN